jgi:DNA ligase-1
VHLLAGGRPRRALSPALLRREAAAMAGVGDWLFDACHQRVGNLAETLALMLPPPATPSSAAWPNGCVSTCCRCVTAAGSNGQLRDYWLPRRPSVADVGACRRRLRIGASCSQPSALPAMAWQRPCRPAPGGRLASGSRPAPSAWRTAGTAYDGGRDAGQLYPVMALPERAGPTTRWRARRLVRDCTPTACAAARRAGRWIWADGDHWTDRFPDVVGGWANCPTARC